MRSKRSRSSTSSQDMWNGKPLPSRGVLCDSFHYRIYDSRTGELLSFNSTNSLNSFAADVLLTAAEHPGVVLRLVQYDGPAY